MENLKKTFSTFISGYSVDAVTSSRGSQLYIAGAPRFNHTGKVIIFTLKNNGNLTILQALLGQQVFCTHTSFNVHGHDNHIDLKSHHQ